MKAFLTATLVLLTPALVLAQTTAALDITAAKSGTTTKAKAKVKTKHKASRTEIKSTAKNMAAGIEAAEDAMTPIELAIAERVYVGTLPCELGNSVVLTSDSKSPGYFNVEMKNLKYRMFPVATTTGAIRLEDKNAGSVWLQLANKSMLLNQKLGQRLADDCLSPTQTAVAEAMKEHPGPSVLDAPVKTGAALAATE